MKFQVCIVVFMVLLSGCDTEYPSDLLTLPSNLETKSIVEDDGSGKVSFQISADNVNYYTIYFGDEIEQKGVVTVDGAASHTYESTGVYTVHVRANTTQRDFIHKSFSLYVKLASSEDVKIPDTGETSPTTYPGMELVWQDEFEGIALNSAFWKHELGTGVGGWGNNELQSYRQENTEVKEGHLIITAKKEAYEGSEYTSSRIVTEGLKSFKYGRIDIRASLPQGQGIWPALWMLGANFKTTGWPACGEIDIMEMIGGSGRENTVHGTLHWGVDVDNRKSKGGDNKKATGTFSEVFHVYSIVWTENSIDWYVNNVKFHSDDISTAEKRAFQEEFFFIFNVAVGGDWPKAPNDNTIFPQRMLVDYVRVFQ